MTASEPTSYNDTRRSICGNSVQTQQVPGHLKDVLSANLTFEQFGLMVLVKETVNAGMKNINSARREGEVAVERAREQRFSPCVPQWRTRTPRIESIKESCCDALPCLLRQCLHFGTSFCVSICTFVLASAGSCTFQMSQRA
jgi:hypothetical protein